MRIILGALITLALTLTPQTAQTSPTNTKKKNNTSTTLVKKKAPTTASTSRSRPQRTTRQTRRTAPRSYDRISPGAESVSRASVAGVGETPPLMRVIPQRDGRFLLEPLTPQKETPQLSGPTSMLDPKSNATPPSRGYNQFEPWNFQDLILSRAKTYRGTPYRMGGSLATGSTTDCSAFVQYIYQGFKIELPRTSAQQAHLGRIVTQNMDFSKMIPGDLLFFRRGNRRVGHIGIYMGEGKMIHAASRRSGGVIVSDLRDQYYQRNFVVAKRVFEVEYPEW